MPVTKGTLITNDSGETVGSIPFFADDGRTKKLIAELRVVVDGPVTAGSGNIPSRFEWYTTTTGGTLTKALTIDASQQLLRNGGTGRSKFLSAPIIAALASLGTSTSASANSLWISEIFIDRNVTLTGLGVLSAGVSAGNGIVALYDSAGTLLASSASTANSGTNAFQEFAFSATYAAIGPARYFGAYICNNGNQLIRTIAVPTDTLTSVQLQGGFAAPSTITVPSANTANVGPYLYAY